MHIVIIQTIIMLIILRYIYVLEIDKSLTKLVNLVNILNHIENIGLFSNTVNNFVKLTPYVDAIDKYFIKLFNSLNELDNEINNQLIKNLTKNINDYDTIILNNANKSIKNIIDKGIYEFKSEFRQTIKDSFLDYKELIKTINTDGSELLDNVKSVNRTIVDINNDINNLKRKLLIIEEKINRINYQIN